MKKLKMRLGILRVVLLGAMLMVCLAGITPIAAAESAVESTFLSILNTERAAEGKSSLTCNSSLTAAAYLHSKDMAENNYFSHTSQDGRTFVQRINNAGYSNYYSLGENIARAYGAPDAAKVFNMWKNSSGHYANMIGNFNEAGLGIYSRNGYTWYTLDLGRSRNPAPGPTPTPTTTPTPATDFSISASPQALTIRSGASAGSTLRVSSSNGFSGAVSLTATSVPYGWTVNFNPAILDIEAGDSSTSTMTVSVPLSAAAGTRYLTVKAKKGTLSHTATVRVTVSSSLTVPSAPRNLKATPGNARVALSWSAPLSTGGSAVRNYRIYRRTATESEKLLATTGVTLSYSDLAAANGQTYYYRVTAVNSSGESPKSTEVSATPTAPIAKTLSVAITTGSPVYSRNLSASAAVRVTDTATGSGVSQATVYFTIYYPSGALAGRVYRMTDSTGKAVLNFSVGPSAQLGTYKITASASRTGYQTGSGETTFIVK